MTKLFSDDSTSKKEVGIHNQNFASVLLANNNPNYMFVREAVKNMIEAVLWFLSNGTGQFKTPLKMFIRALPLKGYNEPDEFTAPKLSFLNLKGMTADQLEVASSITGSVDKEQDLDANFGIGIISSVTTFSDLMFISRKDGITNMTVVGFRNHQLKRLDPVHDCSEWADYYAKERGYDRYGDADFTEVIILGRESDMTQNTFECPYAPGVKIGKPNWLLATVYTRFANINKNIELIFEGFKVNGRPKSCIVHTLNSGENNYTFRSWNKISDLALSRKFQNFEKETVTLSNGTEIDYIYDGPTENEKGEGRPTTVNHFKTGFDSVFSAIEFQGEYFDIYSGLDRKEYGHFSGPNKTVMNRLGVIEGSQYFRVIVRLPKKGLSMNFSRTAVTEKTDNFQKPIELLDYVSEIFHNRPEWFITKISEHNSNVDVSDFEDKVREMLKDFFEGDTEMNLSGRVKGDFNKEGESTGKSTGGKPTGRNSGSGKGGTKFTKTPTGKREFSVGLSIPKVLFVQNNKTLGSDIAEYRESESGQDEIVINENHKTIERFTQKYANTESPIYAQVKNKAKECIGQYLAFTCTIALASKMSSRNVFDYSDFLSWVSNPSLNLKSKEGMPVMDLELKTYARKLNKTLAEPPKPGDEMFSDSLKISKNLPVTTNIQGEEVVI